MPDPFFTSSKSRKRKRSATSGDAGRTRIAKRVARTGPHPHSAKGKRRGDKTASGLAKTKVNGVREKKKNPIEDEEIESDRTGDEGGGDIEDMELRAPTDDDEGASGEEDTTETPAEKRLRLAKLYLESIKEGLGECYFHSDVNHLKVLVHQRKESSMRPR
jgi:ribosomal RNA-processing protein 9